MLVTPELISQVASLELKARQIVEGFMVGLHKSPYYGFSVEFAEHRPYNPGDSLKHLDWKVYAKTERYYVKQYEEETNLNGYLLLDTSSSMYYKYHADWSKLKYGIHLGAALLYMLNRQRDASGFIPFSDNIEEIVRARSSYSHLQRIFGKMEGLLNEKEAPQNKRTATAQVIHEVAERLKKRSLIILVTDLFENVEERDALLSSLKHLRHRNHEVILFNLLERRSERDLEFPDQKMMFKDMETGGQMEVIPSQIREAYRKKVEEHTRSFKIACNEAQIDFEEVDTEQAFEYALLSFLNKRKRLN